MKTKLMRSIFGLAMLALAFIFTACSDPVPNFSGKPYIYPTLIVGGEELNLSDRTLKEELGLYWDTLRNELVLEGYDGPSLQGTDSLKDIVIRVEEDSTITSSEEGEPALDFSEGGIRIKGADTKSLHLINETGPVVVQTAIGTNGGLEITDITVEIEHEHNKIPFFTTAIFPGVTLNGSAFLKIDSNKAVFFR